MLVYLDQNHASRVAKYLRGQPQHEHFGAVHEALMAARPLVPPSPFHVLETRGGYLLPTLQELFGELSGGYWVRPYQEVVMLQARREALDRRDLLTRAGAWDRQARLEPLQDLLEVRASRDGAQGRLELIDRMADRFEMRPERARRLPFFRLLARLVAFRALDDARRPHASDLTDLVMAATIAPYADALATDRYLREILVRVGHRGPVFSGRRSDVLAFADWLRARR